MTIADFGDCSADGSFEAGPFSICLATPLSSRMSLHRSAGGRPQAGSQPEAGVGASPLPAFTCQTRAQSFGVSPTWRRPPRPSHGREVDDGKRKWDWETIWEQTFPFNVHHLAPDSFLSRLVPAPLGAGRRKRWASGGEGGLGGGVRARRPWPGSRADPRPRTRAQEMGFDLGSPDSDVVSES